METTTWKSCLLYGLNFGAVKKQSLKSTKRGITGEAGMALQFILEQGDKPWMNTVTNNRIVYQTDLDV